MLLDQELSDLSLRGRPYSFRFSTSLIAAFSRARSAYIRFSFVFSASSSRNRFTSETVAPPYFPRHLKNVARLTPCFRSRSVTGTPLSASFRIPTIWLSLNFDFRMTAPDPEQSTLGCQSIGEAYALNSGGLEILDSRNSDTNGPPIETLRYIGTTKFSFGSVQNQTNCQIPPQFGPLKIVSVNVLNCLPNFWAKDRGIEHVAGGPVTIHVPPTLAGTNIDLALGHAANAWDTALANYGNPVTFSLAYFGCDGSDCIKVSEAGIPGCGDMVPATLVDGGGAWQTPATLRVNDSWRNWTDPSFLDWLMAHELAHSLGLWEQQDCQLSQSLMAPFGACGQHMNTTGPTVNNSMPAKKTTYNPQGTTAVCR